MYQQKVMTNKQKKLQKEFLLGTLKVTTKRAESGTGYGSVTKCTDTRVKIRICTYQNVTDLEHWKKVGKNVLYAGSVPG
jgi:hypothetical protein